MLLVALLCFVSMTAQNLTVHGIVEEQSGEPLIGASVVAGDRTRNAVATDVDGKFTLTVAPGTKLTVSYIGYETKTVTVHEGETSLRIVLNENNTLLDEVVAIGYGTQKKRLVTGATTQVKGSDVAARNTVSPVGALQGQTPRRQHHVARR